MRRNRNMLHQCRGSVGEGIIEKLSEELTGKYGKGFDKRSLYRYVQFYQMYPEIVGTVTPQSGQYSIFIENRRINDKLKRVNPYLVLL